MEVVKGTRLSTGYGAGARVTLLEYSFVVILDSFRPFFLSSFETNKVGFRATVHPKVKRNLGGRVWFRS